MRYMAALLFACCLTSSLQAQPDLERRLADAEHRLQAVESEAGRANRAAGDAAPYGFVAFLYGAFCALSVQNTGRRPWLWFFLGGLFSVITVIVLLVKNSNDRTRLLR